MGSALWQILENGNQNEIFLTIILATFKKTENT